MNNRASAPDVAAGSLKRILVVEDHPIFRDGLIEVIRLEPDLCVCGQTGDAFAAMELAKRTRPDVALVDLRIAGKSGLELIKDLRAELPKLPILAISMHEELVYAQRVLRAGGRGYVMKLENCDAVIAAIRQVLAGEIAVSPRVMTKLFNPVGARPPRAADPIDTLTDRELEVFEAIGNGKSNAAIGEELHISLKTVEAHRARIKDKLGAESATQLVVIATRWADCGSNGVPDAAPPFP